MQPGFPPNDSSYTFSPRVTHFVYKCQKGSGYLTHKCQQQLSAGLGWDQTSLAFFLYMCSSIIIIFFLTEGEEETRLFHQCQRESSVTEFWGELFPQNLALSDHFSVVVCDQLVNRTVIIIINFLSFKGPL